MVRLTVPTNAMNDLATLQKDISKQNEKTFSRPTEAVDWRCSVKRSPISHTHLEPNQTSRMELFNHYCRLFSLKISNAIHLSTYCHQIHTKNIRNGAFLGKISG